MSPKYVFRIDEIMENPAFPAAENVYGHWQPSRQPGGSLRQSSDKGVTGKFWYCNGQNIVEIAPNPNMIANLGQHHSFSIYYCDGYGFWILHGDATGDPQQQPWRPLTFEHDGNNYSSYLTNAGAHPTLRVQRQDQYWPSMLLPDIYQTPARTAQQTYGGLKGDLGLFLGLVAFSMRPENLRQFLTSMFREGSWQNHGLPHGRTHQRGVVVYVYPYPPDTNQELERYENGDYGLYYY